MYQSKRVPTLIFNFRPHFVRFFIGLLITISGGYPQPAAVGQIPTNSLPTSTASAVQKTQTASEPVMTQFKKTVVFLETDCSELQIDGSRKITPYLGTGFAVEYHDERYPQIGGFKYLVTNRHVVQPGIENNAPCTVVDYKVRLNLKNPGAGNALSQAGSMGPNVPWTFPSEPSVDLAVMPFGADQNQFSFLTIPSAMFLSSDLAKTQRVVEGDSVVFTGLFIQFLGQIQLEPIVREGKIAMIPGESVPTTLKSLGDVYLIDAHVFGGNSGSPVMVNLAGQRDSGLKAGFEYKLLGIISGYVQESSELTLNPVAGYAGTVVANSGIAMVVPCQKLLDLLAAPNLAAQRADAFMQAQKANLLPAPATK